jgi:hypothetical protein
VLDRGDPVTLEADDGLTDWEHDDHADVHVICSPEGADFFGSVEKSSTVRLRGFSSDIKVPVKGRGSLIRNFGSGVWVDSASKNLMSAIQLRKSYTRVPSDGNIIRYMHKEDQSVVTFRLMSDGYYHARMSSTVGPLMDVEITKVLESKVCLKTFVTDKPEDEEGFGAQSRLTAIEGSETSSRRVDGETLHLELNGVDARHDEMMIQQQRTQQQHSLRSIPEHERHCDTDTIQCCTTVLCTEDYGM